MSQYNIIVSTAEATVVSEYEPQQTRSDAYQSEAALEAAFIKQLTEQGYTYLQIHNSDELVKNLDANMKKAVDDALKDKTDSIAIDAAGRISFSLDEDGNLYYEVITDDNTNNEVEE